jgi:hypothetical protein
MSLDIERLANECQFHTETENELKESDGRLAELLGPAVMKSLSDTTSVLGGWRRVDLDRLGSEINATLGVATVQRHHLLEAAILLDRQHRIMLHWQWDRHQGYLNAMLPGDEMFDSERTTLIREGLIAA